MKVIVAPLHWGLGHASRCVPIITSLLNNGFTPIIASDEEALLFLQKEFPTLDFINLPSYNIRYKKHLKISLVFNLFKILKTIKKERRIIEVYINDNKDVVGVISDNRFGVYHPRIKSVYITHQLKVLSGLLSFLTSFFHKRIINKYDECWIPDESNSLLSGELSKNQSIKIPKKFIGNLSRLKIRKEAFIWDTTILLSGPEPRRTIIEKRIINQFKDTKDNVLLIRGVVNSTPYKEKIGKLTMVNYMLSDELETALNASKKIIARAGYSSILDLSKLEKNVTLIPTKEQNEQEYLARFLKKEHQINYVFEDKIETTKFDELDFNQLPKSNTKLSASLFDLFQGK